MLTKSVQVKSFALIILCISFLCTTLHATQVDEIQAFLFNETATSFRTIIKNYDNTQNFEIKKATIIKELKKKLEAFDEITGSHLRLYETHKKTKKENYFLNEAQYSYAVGLKTFAIEDEKDPYDNIDSKKTCQNFFGISQETKNEDGLISWAGRAAIKFFTKQSPYNIGNKLFTKLSDYRESLSVVYGEEKTAKQNWDEITASATKKMIEEGMLNVKNLDETLEKLKKGFMAKVEITNKLANSDIGFERINEGVAEQRIDAVIANILFELVRKLIEGYENSLTNDDHATDSSEL